MAAAVSTLARANKKLFYGRAKAKRRLLNAPDENPDGLILAFDSGSFTPASTETDDIDDEIQVIRFPDGFKLIDFQIVSTADVDTGSGALVYDVIVDDNTTETVLISGCTVGATASGKDEMDRNGGNLLLDVGGLYLSLKITTPANANAGTGALRIKGYGYQGSLINVSA